MNIAGILEEQARRYGDRPAIIEPGRGSARARSRITFSELDGAAAAMAADLARAGVRSGMRALVVYPMSIDLYTIVIALFRLRATAVFVDPSAGRAQLDRCVRRVAPAVFIGVPRAHLLRVVSSAMRAIPTACVIGRWLPATVTIGRASAGRAASEPCDAETPAIITFTSGSTGTPKAAVRTHGFLLAQHRALVESLRLAPGAVDLCTLPIFVLANLASGVTSVIPDADLRAPGAIDPVRLEAQIRSARPSRVVASPALLERLAAHASAHRITLDAFERIYTGGAPVFPITLDAIARVAPGAAVTAVYGSTEAEPIAEIDRQDVEADDRAAMRRGAGLLVGRPVDAITLRILRDRWGQAAGPWTASELDAETLGAMEQGEIAVTGGHVLPGYLDGIGDEETKIHADGAVWHRTGDAGYLDARGRLWLLGRCAAKAVDGDGVLYPFAVECAAADVPGIRRTAFALHRQRRILAVEIEDHAADVRAELQARLAWARLAAVVIVPRVPVDRRHNAKVDHPALQVLLDRLIVEP